jgi:hypothetical protein
MRYLKKFIKLIRKSFIELKKRIKIYKYLVNRAESRKEKVKIYELTPSININDNTYLNYLVAALDKKNITNIALSGPYGSGKSSILKALIKKMSNNFNYKFLNISLATFKDKEEKVELTPEEYTSIEKSILQQMLYSVEQSEIPNSRFRRIKFDKNISRNSFLFSIWIVSIIELFSPYTFIYHYFSYFDLTFIFSIIFGLGFLKLGKTIYETTSNIKLSKFNIQNQEISFDSDKQTSILNANIDEIIYFFNTTNYNVMIIEDLDRFNNIEIFIKLREINTLLNNRTNGKKVTFIYAIKDDMFKNKDRTKFFDYIVPVVPFINSSNSSKKLIELLKKENLLNEANENNSNKVDEKFIKDISIYINDMRFLINVFNEFIQYAHKLTTDIELNFNSLFAISLYKNYKPDDFAKLHNDEGILYTLFSQKYKNMILTDITKDLNADIGKLTIQIDKINSLTVQRIEELRSLYIFNLMNLKNHLITHIYVNSSQVQTIDVIKNHFEIFSNERNNIFYISNGQRIDSNITFDELGKLVDENYTYEEKKAAIELKNTTSIEELKKERENKQKELSKIKVKTINELLIINEIDEKIIINKENLNLCLFDKVIQEEEKIDILKDDLLMYLLRYGYIKEDYFKYISYYHPGQETPNDINFILNIQRNGKGLAYNLELSNFEYIFNELNSENYFSKEAILNYSLINTLLNKKEFVNQFKILDSATNSKYSEVAINKTIMFILSDFKNRFDFIDSYIDIYNDISILEYKIWWTVGLWEFVMMNKDFSIEKKDKYFYLIFKLNEKNKTLKLLETIDKNNQLSQYIINKTTFNDFVKNIIDFKSFIEFLKSKGLTFKKLDDIDYKSEKFNFIYENNLYRINFEWISKILYSSSEDDLKLRNYSSILLSGKEKLIKYIHKNINLYVENVLLIHGNLEDNEKDIIQLLNNEELKDDNKIIIIDRYTKQFNDISEIIDFSWEELLKNNKITPTPHNIKTCVENEIDRKHIQNFINLESTYSAIFDIPNKYDENEIESLGLENIIFDGENITIETFEAFLKSINYKYEIFPEGLNHQFMQYMIELNKVETNPQNCKTLIDNEYSELTIKLLENEPKQFIHEINSFFSLANISYEILIELIKGNKFSDEEKISLLNSLDIEELLQHDTNKFLIDILYKLKINSFDELTDDVFYELMKSSLSKNHKLELFIKYSFKDREEVTIELLNISPNFEKITQFVSGPIPVRNDDFYLKLLGKLKEINYISSFSPKNDKLLNIYTHRIEKEIVIS